MAPEYCKAKGTMCDPKGCNVELCWWRDTVWAIRQMSRWAYSDNPGDRITKSEEKEDNNQKLPSK